MSSINLEGLEIKEATPSIAPSIYESIQYTKKWRIILALLVGFSLIGVCVLVFYLSAEAKKPQEDADTLTQKEKLLILSSDEGLKKWRKERDCLTSVLGSCPKDFGEIPVFLLVLGGLRIDQVPEIPALLEYVKCGASSESLVPSYPTFNYPNLYSIATGLYPESHGIVSYEMFDKEMNQNFTVDSPSSFNSGWWHGEPIWNTVGKSGKKSATYLWPGSNVQIQGRFPTYWQKEKIDFITRIQKVVDWIELPAEERPQLIMMYYEEPVTTSLNYGPFSPRTVEELSTINVGLDELMTKLIEADLLNCVNIVIASEHGVAASACDNSLYVEDFLEEDIPGRLYTGTVGRIDFREDADKKLINKITNTLKCKKNGLRTLKKNEVPIRYHYTKGDRIGDLILDTRTGYRIAKESESKCLEGEFGYDNSIRSMQGVFIGHGPSFRVGYRTESFRNVEIYNLLSYLSGVDPAPNNGTSGSLLHLLRKDLVSENDYEEETATFLSESVKHLPVRPNNGVLGKFSEVEKNPVSCSCVHEPLVESSSADTHESGSSSEPSELSSSSTSTTVTTSTSAITTSESTPASSSLTTDITTSSTSSNSEEIISLENETLASSASYTESSTTSSTESDIILVHHEANDTLMDHNSTSDSISSVALNGHLLHSSSAEAVGEELSTVTFVPLMGLSTGILLGVEHSTEHSISMTSENENAQEASSSNTTNKGVMPEPRHVAEIILAHESQNHSEHNDTEEELILEHSHRAESLVANENQFDIINVEDSINHDHHHNEEFPLDVENPQNATESSLDTTFVTENVMQFDENNDYLNNTQDDSLAVTLASEQLGDELMEELSLTTENIQDNIINEVIPEEQHEPISDAIEHINLEVHHADISGAVEHAAEHSKSEVSHAEEFDAINQDLVEAAELIETSKADPTTESVVNIYEETESTPVEPDDQVIPESVQQTNSELKPLLELEQPENQHMLSEQHHVHEDIQEEIPTTEKVASPMEEILPGETKVSTEETKVSTEETHIEKDAFHYPSEEAPKLQDENHSEISGQEASVIESQKEEIEILPIPESLKSMSLVKDIRNIDSKDEYLLQNFHCPWGFPRFSAPEVASDTLNILPHSSHIIGLPESLNMGVWTSFSMSKERLNELNKARPSVPEGIYVSPEEKKNNMLVGCWISDSRLQRSSSDQCSRSFQTDLYKAKNASLRQLFPEDLEFPANLNKEGYLLSNMAPVMKGYDEGPRTLMINAIKKWVTQKGLVNVVHGPVFDYDYDGRRDAITVVRNTIKPLIPSSYFFVVTICNETKASDDSTSEEESEESASEAFNSCPLLNLNVYSFVFPNTEEDDKCLMSDRDYLLYHLASLADVEDLTSLKFFRNLDPKSKVQLRARQPLKLLPI